MAYDLTPNIPTNADVTTYARPVAEQPTQDWTGGLNIGGACAGGLGINTADYNPTLTSWSLNDQDGDPRTPQQTQIIGGVTGDGAAQESVAYVNVVVQEYDDANDTLSFVAAEADTAPGAVLAGTTVNRSNKTVPAGAYAWGTDPVA